MRTEIFRITVNAKLVFWLIILFRLVSYVSKIVLLVKLILTSVALVLPTELTLPNAIVKIISMMTG